LRVDAAAVLQYWLDVLSRPDWDKIGKLDAIAEYSRYDDLYAASLPCAAMAADEGDATLALVGRRGSSALVAIPVVAEPDGSLRPHPGGTILLNPAFFVHDETLLDRNSLAIAGEILEPFAPDLASWAGYLDSVRERFAAVSLDIDNLGGRVVRWRAVQLTKDAENTAFWILRVYERLIGSPPEEWPAVFSRMVGQNQDRGPDSMRRAAVAHVDEVDGSRRVVRPLDASQREALQYALALEESRVLTVHGPPGTGKTSFLRALIASLWVEPLLQADITTAQPPLIVGTAGTNKAVENMIGTFDNAVDADGDFKEPRLDRRLIAGVPSYGWFVPAKRKRDGTNRPYLTLDKGLLAYNQVAENVMAVAAAEFSAGAALDEMNRAYVTAAARMMGRFFVDVDDVVAHLHSTLLAFHREREDFRARLDICLTMPGEPEAAEIAAHSRRLMGWRTTGGGLAGIAAEVGSKLAAMWRLACAVLLRWRAGMWRRRHVPEIGRACDLDRPAWLDAALDKDARGRATGMIRDLLSKPRGPAFEKELRLAWQEFDETVYLPATFHLAARIWEGRWLQRMGEIVETGPPSVPEQMRIAMMLGPCVVATMHMLPSLFMKGRREMNAEADLLILDEAGQASAQLAAASFAFCKRAVIVGDEEQLRPVFLLEKAEERTLLRARGLEDLPEALRFASGTALDMAKTVTILPDNSPPGVQLLHHYRCRGPIIEFCNRLRYAGRLVPCRPEPDPCPPWPAMSYVLTDGTYREPGGTTERHGGWSNREEAREIARWLAEEKDRLERHYRRPLVRIAAVLTPFVRQGSVLREEIAAALGDITGMTIGTVNSLQGMECPVVLFSTVVTRRARSTWLDGNAWLLNVAVSRAQDSFVAFGDAAVLFETPARTPLASLGAYMRAHGELLYPRSMVIVEAPGKERRIQDALGRRCLVIATGGHVRELPPFDAEVDWNFPWREKDPARLERLGRFAERLRPVVIATDDDREGEAIAWHVLDAMARRGVRLAAGDVRRMRFSSLAPEALRTALETAGPGLDANRVRAALTRDVADYLIGKYHSRRLGEGVGRVQAALLEAVAERLAGRQPARLRVDVRVGNEAVRGYVVESATSVARPAAVESPEQAERMRACLLSGAVEDIGIKSIMRRAPALSGADTSDVLSLAARVGIKPEDAMDCLERLYLAGDEAR